MIFRPVLTHRGSICLSLELLERMGRHESYLYSRFFLDVPNSDDDFHIPLRFTSMESDDEFLPALCFVEEAQGEGLYGKRFTSVHVFTSTGVCIRRFVPCLCHYLYLLKHVVEKSLESLNVNIFSFHTSTLFPLYYSPACS